MHKGNDEPNQSADRIGSKRRLKVSREMLKRLGDSAMRRAAGGTGYTDCPSDPCNTICTIVTCPDPTCLETPILSAPCDGCITDPKFCTGNFTCGTCAPDPESCCTCGDTCVHTGPCNC